MAPARFDILDHVCAAGGQHNDDIWGRGDTAVWVLDGATGLSAERILAEGASDAAWFAAAIDATLQAADWGGPTRDILRDAVAAVEARFRAAAKRIPRDDWTWPAAAIALLRVDGRAVELSNLGDCKLLFRGSADKTTRAFGSSAVTALDALTVRHMVALQAQGVTEPAELWSRLVPLMQEGRKLRNSEGGYWVLDMSRRGLDHRQETTLPAEQMSLFLMMTDGFYRLADTHHAYSDDGLLDAAFSRGLADLYAELRSIEARDPRCSTHPRIKIHDDATAVLGRIGDP